jgi:hypothetical protein
VPPEPCVTLIIEASHVLPESRRWPGFSQAIGPARGLTRKCQPGQVATSQAILMLAAEHFTIAVSLRE